MRRLVAVTLPICLAFALPAGPSRADEDDDEILAFDDDPAAHVDGEGDADGVPSRESPPAATLNSAVLARLTSAVVTEGSFKVRTTAAVALGRLGDRRATAALARALSTDRHYAVRAAAASALGRVGDTAAVPPLLLALGDPDTLVQSTASEALTRFHAPAYLLAFREAARAEDARVRRVAIRAYGEALRAGHVPAATFVMNALSDEDAEVRGLAERSLKALRHEHALPLLLRGLSDGAASVRAGSARLLGGRQDERAVAPLLDALSRAGEREEVRRAVREALQRHREYVDHDTLLQRARAEDPERQPDRVRALRLLGALGDEQALQALKGAFSDRSARVRTAAAQAAADLGGPGARDLLEGALQAEADPRVRKQMTLLLKSTAR